METTNNLKACYVWCRVSSREQEEGYSLQAQQDIIGDYLRENGLKAVQTFVVQESASNSDTRDKFKDMFRKLKDDSKCFDLVVHKADRLARNLKDSAAIKDWLDTDVRNNLHVVQGKSIFNKDSTSSQKFMFNIHSTMANFYADNLSEEVKKGMDAKAASGIYPGKAPRGYKNVQSDDNKRSKRWIVVDEKEAPLVKKLFEMYATGMYALSDLSRIILDEGLKTEDKKWGDKLLKGGNELSKEVIRQMLMNVFYTGKYFWKGQIYEGTHGQLVSQQMFDQVQQLLSKRRNGSKGGKTNLLFKRLIRCGECGRMVVGQTQDNYTYYRCSLHPYKNQIQCSQQKYVEEGALEDEIVKQLGDFTMPKDMLDALKKELLNRHDEEMDYHRQIIKNLETDKNNLQIKIDRLHEMRMEREIDVVEYQERKEKIKKDLLKLQDTIALHKQFDNDAYKKAVNSLDVAKNPKTMWFRFEIDEKRKLLNYLFSNLQLKDKILLVQWKKPFDLLSKYQVNQDLSG